MLQLINKYKVILIIGFMVLCTSIYSLVNQKEQTQLVVSDALSENVNEKSEQLEDSPKQEVLISIPVYICGAIKNPGVYWVQQETLVDTLIKQAGGTTEDSDLLKINLARKIVPNEKIYIPKTGEQIDKSLDSYDNSSTGLTQPGKININEADQTTLQQLPGIGSVKANQIIHYRNTYGPFETIEALKDVSGIGEKTYSLVEGLISAE